MDWRKRKTGKNTIDTLKCLEKICNAHVKMINRIMVPHGTLKEHLKNTRRLWHYNIKLERENKHLQFLADSRLEYIKSLK